MNAVLLSLSLVVLFLASLLHFTCCWPRVVHRFPTRLQHHQIKSGPTTDARFQMVFPGTVWCGPGSLSADYNNLGILRTTDECCRHHDFCHDSIEPGQTKYGLTNNAIYYKLHCDCDEEFLACLKADSLEAGHLISAIYFDVINTQCFREDYPIIKCVSFKNKMSGSCQAYELNTTAPKIYQFFDVSTLL